MSKKWVLFGVLLALGVLLSIGAATAGINPSSTVTATYTNGNVVCQVFNNGDGTVSFACTAPAATMNTLNMALSTRHGYQETITDENGEEVPNPESRAEYSLRVGLFPYLSGEFYAYQIDEWAASKPANTFTQ